MINKCNRNSLPLSQVDRSQETKKSGYTTHRKKDCAEKAIDFLAKGAQFFVAPTKESQVEESGSLRKAKVEKLSASIKESKGKGPALAEASGSLRKKVSTITEKLLFYPVNLIRTKSQFLQHANQIKSTRQPSLQPDEQRELLLRSMVRVAFPGAPEKELNITSCDTVLHSYKIAMSSEELFDSINNIIRNDNCPKETQVMLLKFCKSWIQSGLYTKDLQDVKIKKLLNQITDYTSSSGSKTVRNESKAILQQLKKFAIVAPYQKTFKSTSGSLNAENLVSQAVYSKKNYLKAVELLSNDMTMIATQQLSSFKSEEIFIDWSKKDKVHASIDAVTSHVNRTGTFIAQSILSSKNEKEVRRKAQLFIDVAFKCIDKGDFNTPHIILSALSHFSVDRLVDPAVDKPQSSVLLPGYLRKLSSLHALYSDSHNYSSLKDAYNSRNFYIPLFSKFLSEAQFMKDGNQTFNANEEVNTEKLKLMGDHIRLITGLQGKIPASGQKLSTDLVDKIGSCGGLGEKDVDKVLDGLTQALLPKNAKKIISRS